VRGPLQPCIRSTGQDFFNLLLCCCSSRGHEEVLSREGTSSTIR
jgi:hypothetical protein